MVKVHGWRLVSRMTPPRHAGSPVALSAVACRSEMFRPKAAN